MVKAYPVLLTETKDGYLVDIPDFNMNTQGRDIPDAIFMARDAIGLIGIDIQDDGKELPEPHSREVKTESNQIFTLVDIDFGDYRRRHDNKAVKKNCTIPSWLAAEAENAGINFSKVLQEALLSKLHIES